jgi:hypothetical protein
MLHTYRPEVEYFVHMYDVNKMTLIERARAEAEPHDKKIMRRMAHNAEFYNYDDKELFGPIV